MSAALVFVSLLVVSRVDFLQFSTQTLARTQNLYLVRKQAKEVALPLDGPQYAKL
jgi:hypothetical protein